MTDESPAINTDELADETVEAMKATGEWMSIRIATGGWADNTFVKLTEGSIDAGTAIAIVFERGVMPNHPELALQTGREIGATIGRMLAAQVIAAHGGTPEPEPKRRITEIRQRRRNDA